MSTVTPVGHELLRRLSDPNFGENFNIRSDKPGAIYVVARTNHIRESKAEKVEAMCNAACVMAEVLSQVDLSTVKEADPYTITNNLITLRERMLNNATFAPAASQTSIETHMNRAIGALNPTLFDRVFSFPAKVLSLTGRIIIKGLFFQNRI